MKCNCNTCSGHLDFDESHLGETIQCPHCGMETVLYERQDKSGEKIMVITTPAPKGPTVQNPKPETVKSASPFQRDWISVGLQLIIALAAITIAILVYSYTNRTRTQIEPLKYEVSEFTFPDSITKIETVGKNYENTITFGWMTSAGVGNETNRWHWGQPEFCSDAGSVLNHLGDDGWHLVWSDGKHYIVQRPQGHWAFDAFMLGAKPITNDLAQ